MEASRPFDALHDGFVMSEGAGVGRRGGESRDKAIVWYVCER